MVDLGWRQSPRELFDDVLYRNRYPDTEADPYGHYAVTGRIENRQPNLHFSPGWFRRTYPQSAGRNLLEFACETDEDIFPNPFWQMHGWAQDRLRDAVELAGQVRTTGLIGLFGSGRTFLNDLILSDPRICLLLQNSLDSLGTPARFPVICSGHATLTRPSAYQKPPEFTREHIVGPLEEGRHAVVFIMRHPLDSLLSNWAWWWEYGRTGTPHDKGITGIFGANETFHAVLDASLPEFAAFAQQGDVSAYAPDSIPFLSFDAFLQETLAWIDMPGVRTIRFEDFQTRSAETMAILNDALFPDGGHSLPVMVPRSRSYAYKAVLEQMPGARRIVHDLLTSGTMRILNRLGYGI